LSAAEDAAPRIAVTMGDPRGIGPEIILKALSGHDLPADAGLVVVGAREVLEHEARALGLDVDLPTAGSPGTGAVSLVDLGNFPAERLTPHSPDASAGRASVEYIERAVRMALDGDVDAVVTAPINKEAIAAAGSPFAGHTEMLAHLTGGSRPVMLMVSEALRVALVTTHMALRDVPKAITGRKVMATTQIVADGVRRFFGVEEPRIAVCGLNPHASDGGRFGNEEQKIIAPAVAKLRQTGLDVIGPVPSDTAFLKARQDAYDAVVALYHDQALIPVKMSGLGSVVNVTLGLRIIRTSVGHGTAYDIAGRGEADEASLVAAIRLAGRMARASGG